MACSTQQASKSGHGRRIVIHQKKAAMVDHGGKLHPGHGRCNYTLVVHEND